MLANKSTCLFGFFFARLTLHSGFHSLEVIHTVTKVESQADTLSVPYPGQQQDITGFITAILVEGRMPIAVISTAKKTGVRFMAILPFLGLLAMTGGMYGMSNTKEIFIVY